MDFFSLWISKKVSLPVTCHKVSINNGYRGDRSVTGFNFSDSFFQTPCRRAFQRHGSR